MNSNNPPLKKKKNLMKMPQFDPPAFPPMRLLFKDKLQWEF